MHKIDDPELKIPEKLAIVMGREGDGPSKAMLEAADKSVYAFWVDMSSLCRHADARPVW